LSTRPICKKWGKIEKPNENTSGLSITAGSLASTTGDEDNRRDRVRLATVEPTSSEFNEVIGLETLFLFNSEPPKMDKEQKQVRLKNDKDVTTAEVLIN
jgi:hypothetical protein